MVRSGSYNIWWCTESLPVIVLEILLASWVFCCFFLQLIEQPTQVLCKIYESGAGNLKCKGSVILFSLAESRFSKQASRRLVPGHIWCTILSIPFFRVGCMKDCSSFQNYKLSCGLNNYFTLPWLATVFFFFFNAFCAIVPGHPFAIATVPFYFNGSLTWLLHDPTWFPSLNWYIESNFTGLGVGAQLL